MPAIAVFHGHSMSSTGATAGRLNALAFLARTTRRLRGLVRDLVGAPPPTPAVDPVPKTVADCLLRLAEDRAHSVYTRKALAAHRFSSVPRTLGTAERATPPPPR
jgi:hypothetical protein